MGSRNNTNVPDYLLLGLTDSEEIWWVLFMLFLLIYLLTMLGNAGMILIICLDLQLHKPMYFFLSHLSFLDVSYLTVITPKTLENVLTSTSIFHSWVASPSCIFFVFLGRPECFLLFSMAYDCYVAMCNPLLYQIMSRSLCRARITGSYMTGFTESLVNVLCISSLHFCKSNVIHHFFCDLMQFFALSCIDTYAFEIIIFFLAGSTVIVSLIAISLSCGSILSTILKINSTSGKCKAFSTCASHLLVVTIFFGSIIFTYLKPKKSYSLGKDLVASVFYTMVIPMLNPFIYSLRNKEVKNALIRVMQKREESSQLK